MENRAHAIVAVGFLIVFSVGAVLIFYWLSSGPSEPRVYRIITRQSVAGLAPQSAVKFKGLLVGHVDSIRFDPQDHSRVIIDFRVQRDTYVTEATYAVLAIKGLMGGKVLQLKLGDGSRQPLATSAAHPTHIPLRKGMIGQLKQTAQQSLQQLQTVLSNVEAILGKDNRKHLAATLRQFDKLTAQLITLEKQLMPTAKQLPELVRQLQKTLNQSQTLLAKAGKLVEQARVPLHNAGKAADEVRQLANRLTGRTLPDIRGLVQNLTRTSRLLRELARQLKANPQSVIFGSPKSQPGPGEPGFDPGVEEAAGHE